MWIANSGDDTVTRINTKTGESAGPFNVGDNPSRTAVNFDGSVWVANRDSHDITYLSSDGGHICTIALHDKCQPRGLAVDKEKNAWVGCGGWVHEGAPDGWLYKINVLSPKDPDYQTNPCKIVPLGEEGDIDGGLAFKKHAPFMIYGMAIDSTGMLWTAPGTLNNGQNHNRHLARFNTNLEITNPLFYKKWQTITYEYYGIVIDEYDDIWYGLWTKSDKTDAVLRVQYDRETDEISKTTFSAETSGNDLTGGRGVAIDQTGNIWAVYSHSHRVAKFDKNGTYIADYPTHSNHNDPEPVGIGIDSENNVWINNYKANNVVELSQDGSSLREIMVGNKPYTYSDMTGFNLRTFVSSTGTFSIVVDTQNVNAVYDSISWEGDTLNGSEIKISVKVGDDITNWYEASDWSSFITQREAILEWPTEEEKPKGRYAKIEVTMTIGNTRVDKPVLRSLRLNWRVAE